MNLLDKNNYHWLVAGGEFLVVAIVMGLCNNLASLYMLPVCEELGIDRGTFSLSVSVRCFMSIFGNLIFSAVYRKFGLRKPRVLVLILIAASYVGYAYATNIVPFLIGAAIYGLGTGIASTGGDAKVISNWFKSRQGTVLGVVLAASGFGGAVTSLILKKIMGASGWRASLLVSAALYMGAMFITLLIIRDRPEEKGLTAYTEEGDGGKKKKHKHYQNEWQGVPVKQLLNKPFFYTCLLGMFLSSISTKIYYGQLVAHVQDQGMTAEFAVTAFAVMQLLVAISKIALGMISDRWGTHTSLFLSVACNAVGVGILAFAKTPAAVLICLPMLGLGTCMEAFMQPLMATELFGKETRTAITGVLLAIVGVSGMFTTTVTNSIFDRIGTYTPIFLADAGISILTALLFVFTFVQGLRYRKQVTAAAQVSD